ncbi:hypothetical protein MKW94_008378 [Papaver nudicaule]|uniref:RING-type E3 ubiquitin transferase n=1 Tax=Papaver nudicaule TaxID=74823 RepID=A0AA41VPU5_PAPNU|nr:hypothetical protein [Papaver nudicaule]
MRRRLETREIIINMKEIEGEEEEVDVKDDEEEEKICRICHGPGDSENPLQYPCAWKACHLLHFCLRICVSVFYQLLMLPLLASWVWRLGYAWGDIPSRALKLVHTRMSPSTVNMYWLCGIGYVLVMTSIVKAFWRGFDALIRDFENDAKDGVHVAVLANNRNHIAVEIGEDAGEQQAIAGVVNVDIITMWSRLQVAFLRFVIRLVVILRVIRLDVPLRKTCIQLVKDIEFFLVTNGLLILVPLSLGQIIMHCLSRLFFAVSPIVMLFIESAFYIGNNLLKNVSHAVANVSAEIQNDYLLSCAVEVVAETLSANSTGPGEALSSGDKPQLVYRSSGLHDVIALAIGYMAIVSLVFVCLGIPIRTIASMIRYYLRKILTTMIYPFFLIIHLVVLPLAYGWWLDVCTSLMLGKSFSDRVDFFSKFPFLSSSMHWTVGIIYMFQIHISTSLLQRVLRKEVRHFRQDLADPIYITSLVLAEDVQVHASQFLYSIAINGILVVFLVYLPVVLAMRLAPTIFPLHIW